MMVEPLHIAFANLASAGWTSGGRYLMNLLAALRATASDAPIRISLLASRGTPAQEYAIYHSFLDQVIEIPNTRWMRLMKSLYLRLPLPAFLERALVPRRTMISQLRAAGVQAVFSNDEYGPHFPIPLLSWIPDFQHLHLPEMFTRSKIYTRNFHNRRIAKYADRVILSSQDASRDFFSFAPRMTSKVRVLYFVTHIPAQIFQADPSVISRRYSLPEKFFYLPNQFWPHKNHLIVVAALDLLRSQSPQVFANTNIVCSGNPHSFHGTQTFDTAMSTIQERGLQEHFHYVGLVPHEDIFHLMRQSMAVLQPSLFEGWSMIVDEACSLGKGIILSDLAVHHEHDHPKALYFNPHDPQSLVECLVQAQQFFCPGPDLSLETIAREHLPGRIQAFARDFLKIVAEVSQ